MKRARPAAPEPFDEPEAKLVRRVATGEISTDRALELAAGGRWLAFLRRYNGLSRLRVHLETEALRAYEDLNKTRAAELVACDAVAFYGRHYTGLSFSRQSNEARASREGADAGRVAELAAADADLEF
jgi:hypothetical protein